MRRRLISSSPARFAMGFDLRSANGPTFRMKITTWEHMLRLAKTFGWTPVGTELREYSGAELDGMREWCSESEIAQAASERFFATLDWNSIPPEDQYWSNDGQWVYGADALLLADALTRALECIPRDDALAHKTTEINGMRCVPVDTPTNAFEWFSGDNRAYLEEFIDFCRSGAFQIN